MSIQGRACAILWCLVLVVVIHGSRMSTSIDGRNLGTFLGVLGSIETTNAATVEQTLSELLEAQGMLDEMSAAVARRPEHQEQARSLLDQVLAQRQALLGRLGEQAMTWLLSGGQIVMHNSAGATLMASPAASEPMKARSAPPSQMSSHLFETLAPPASSREHDEPAPETLSMRAPRDESTRWLMPGEQMSQGDKGMLRTFLDLVGPLRELSTLAAIVDELDGLDALVDTMEKWPLLPKSVQRQLLAMVVARSRALKETQGLSPGIRLRIRDVLSLCPPYAKKNPMGGHINGLQAAHSPLGASWIADAQEFWMMLSATAGGSKALAPHSVQATGTTHQAALVGRMRARCSPPRVRWRRLSASQKLERDGA